MAKWSVRRIKGRSRRTRWAYYKLASCGRAIKSRTAEGHWRQRNRHYDQCRACREYRMNKIIWAWFGGRIYPQLTGEVARGI